MKSRLLKMYQHLRHRPLLIITLMLVTALTILVAVVYFSRDSYTTPSDEDILTYTTDTPDETPPDDYAWQGRPEDPKYISLPSIGAGGFVQKVGIDQNQEIVAPNNIHLAGWFVDTVRPGEMGLSIIDGHVGGRQNSGIFKSLAQMKAGDEYTVERGDGSIVGYKVIEVKSIKTEESASPLFSQEPDVSHQLNLITCSGKFDEQSNQYSERVIVTSRQL